MKWLKMRGIGMKTQNVSVLLCYNSFCSSFFASNVQKVIKWLDVEEQKEWFYKWKYDLLAISSVQSVAMR